MTYSNKQVNNYNNYPQTNKLNNSNEFGERNSHPINMMNMINNNQMQGQMHNNQFFSKNQMIASIKGYEFNMLNFQNNPNISKYYFIKCKAWLK